jgi:hypothetical protein
MNKIWITIGAIVVLAMGYLIIANSILTKLVKNQTIEIAQLKTNQDMLIEGSKEYVLKSDLSDFKEKMDSTTTAILKAQKIKPKWVDELIKTEIQYISNDTTIVNTIYQPESGVYEWEVKKDCIDTEGYVVVNSKRDSTDVDVAITDQKFNVTVTGVKYGRRTKEFKIFKSTIFRYGPRVALVTSVSNCGKSETTITEITK